MATITTHDLIKCNRIYPTLPSVNPSALFSYNGLTVRFDNNPTKSYKVRRNVQGRFLHPRVPVEEGFSYSGQYSITSMKFNGFEMLSAPANLLIDEFTTLDYTTYPLYTVGNEYNYTNNVANAITVGSSPIPDLGFGINNFYLFLESVVNAHNIPVKVVKSHPSWWLVDEFGRLENFSLEKYYDDVFEFTMIVNWDNNGSPFIQTNKYVFNEGFVTHLVDGVNIAVIEPVDAPQYQEESSFLSYDFDYDTIEEIDSCPTYTVPFVASLSTEGCSTMSISCDCKTITFSDTSNYYTNDLPGHDPELFTSRTITMTKPNGEQYIWATSDITLSNQVIQPHYNSTNTFQYTLTNIDEDGIYSFQICTYPDWSNEVYYESFLGTIVRRDGKLYKCTSSSANLDPSNIANAAYWTLYTCTGTCDDTRYCTTEKIVVLCVSLLKCYKQLVADAFCGMKSNPCKNMCDNKAFMNAMKFRVTMDALEFAVCASDWESAQEQVDILKSICCCNG
jgi:hypothetical protein